MTDAIRLRPHSHLARRGLTAVFAFSLPVFIVLYFLTVPDGPWFAVLMTQLVAIAIVIFVSIRYLAAAVWVDSTGITERGFFRMKTRFATADIGSIVMAHTFDASQPAGVPQLFVRGHHGKQLVRMRGAFYSRANMEVVTATLDVPYIPVKEILSPRELDEKFPGLGYWFERRPILAALVFGASAAAVGAIGILVYTIVGAPLGN